MAELKIITPEQKALINKPLPAEAVTQHPTKSFLSSIKSIYVTERLNEVFGIGAWQVRSDIVEKADKGMIVVKVLFQIPEYGIYYECYGGNNNGGEGSKNFDLGDAYKGAVTDALTKIASWLGIGADVFKGKQLPTQQGKQSTQQPYRQPTPAADPIASAKPIQQEKRTLTLEMFESAGTCEAFGQWMYNAFVAANSEPNFDVGKLIHNCYNATDEVVVRLRQVFDEYKSKQLNK